MHGCRRRRLYTFVGTTPATEGTAPCPHGGPERSEVRTVRLAELSVGYSARLVRVDDDHVALLMEALERLPPIIVDEATMTVIDGVHRVEAFRRAGRPEIRAVPYLGDEIGALAIAIQANVRHGKPLSRVERQAAAVVLLRRCPDRSDRWLGEICGLSHSTVARLRQAAASGRPRGQDGPGRPAPSCRPDPGPGRGGRSPFQREGRQYPPSRRGRRRRRLHGPAGSRRAPGGATVDGRPPIAGTSSRSGLPGRRGVEVGNRPARNIFVAGENRP